MIKLYSQEIERACLAAAIKHPDRLIDVLTIITEDHFIFEAHQTIFSAIKAFILSNQKFDSVLLIDKVKSLGLGYIENVDIADYIKALKNLNSVNEESFLEYYANLHKYYNARDISATGKRLQDFVERNLDKKSSELISGAEKIFGDRINKYQKEDEPVDLFKGLKEEIETRGNTPIEDGVINPYPQFRKYFGNFLPGGLYIFCAPAKNGKSTLLLDISRKVSKPGKVKTLYLDTELTTEEQKNRLASALSGVNEYYIRTGKYRLDKNMTEKVRAIWPKVEQMFEAVDHLYVAGKPIDEILSIIRRWKYKNITHEMKPVVIYDYIKLTGEKISESWKEYQVIGEKADKLKQIAQEIRGPVIGAVQTNADMKVAMSKQITWFCSMCGIFRKKAPEEIQQHGEAYGTHIFTITESRNQGECAMGFNDLIKMPDGSYERFFLNFDLQNFNIEERGSVIDVARTMENGHVDVTQVPDDNDTPPDDGIPF
jgi:replicative DNA helicase